MSSIPAFTRVDALNLRACLSAFVQDRSGQARHRRYSTVIDQSLSVILPILPLDWIIMINRISYRPNNRLRRRSANSLTSSDTVAEPEIQISGRTEALTILPPLHARLGLRSATSSLCSYKIGWTFRPVAKGVGAVERPLPGAKRSLSVHCSSANVLSIVRLWNKINKNALKLDSSFDHKVTSSIIIILTRTYNCKQNRSRVSCTRNTSRASIGLIAPLPWNLG